MFCVTRFTPVAYRQGMRRSVAEKYIDIFNWYEADLDEVKNIYEKYKVRIRIICKFLKPDDQDNYISRNFNIRSYSVICLTVSLSRSRRSHR